MKSFLSDFKKFRYSFFLNLWYVIINDGTEVYLKGAHIKTKKPIRITPDWP